MSARVFALVIVGKVIPTLNDDLSKRAREVTAGGILLGEELAHVASRTKRSQRKKKRPCARHSNHSASRERLLSTQTVMLLLRKKVIQNPKPQMLAALV